MATEDNERVREEQGWRCNTPKFRLVMPIYMRHSCIPKSYISLWTYIIQIGHYAI